jgi:hypothetical protein
MVRPPFAGAAAKAGGDQRIEIGGRIKHSAASLDEWWAIATHAPSFEGSFREAQDNSRLTLRMQRFHLDISVG